MNDETTLPSEQGDTGLQKVAARAKATISARVYRAETDTWEELGVISEEDINLTEDQLKELSLKEPSNERRLEQGQADS